MNLDFLSIKKSVQSVGAKIAELRAAIEQAKREREEIAAAPLAREDVKALVNQLFQRARQDFPKRLAESLAGRISKCKSQLPSEESVLRQDLGTNLVGLHMHPTRFPAEAVDLEMGLCALLGDSLRLPILRVVDEMAWPAEPGLPMSERPAILQRLDAKIADLERQLRGILEEAESVGMRV